MDDERKAAEKAEVFLSTLTPSTAHTAEIVDALRAAVVVANAATVKGFSNEAALNILRGDAATRLNAVVGSLARRRVMSQDLIDRAELAVAAWLQALA